MKCEFELFLDFNAKTEKWQAFIIVIDAGLEHSTRTYEGPKPSDLIFQALAHWHAVSARIYGPHNKTDPQVSDGQQELPF
jgi:hypothetical protein